MNKQLPLQRCCVCDEPTGRCEEDAIYLPSADPNGNDLGPLCGPCYEERDPGIGGPRNE